MKQQIPSGWYSNKYATTFRQCRSETSMPQSKCQKYYKAAVAMYIPFTGCGSVVVYLYTWPATKVLLVAARCMYICTCVCMYVCMYVCMCVSTFTSVLAYFANDKSVT